MEHRVIKDSENPEESLCAKYKAKNQYWLAVIFGPSVLYWKLTGITARTQKHFWKPLSVNKVPHSFHKCNSSMNHTRSVKWVIYDPVWLTGQYDWQDLCVPTTTTPLKDLWVGVSVSCLWWGPFPHPLPCVQSKVWQCVSSHVLKKSGSSHRIVWCEFPVLLD